MTEETEAIALQSPEMETVKELEWERKREGRRGAERERPAIGKTKSASTLDLLLWL